MAIRSGQTLNVNIRAKGQGTREAAQRAVNLWALDGFQKVMRDVTRNLSGRVLKSQSGQLIANVNLLSRLITDGFELGVSSEYGKAWELGFSRRAYDILPKRDGGVLKFPTKSGGKSFIYRPSAHVPAKRFKARSYLRSAAEENRAYLLQSLEKFMDAEFFARLAIGQVLNVDVELKFS